MDWLLLRGLFAKHFYALKRATGATQQTVGNKSGIGQGGVSKIINNEKQGPFVETFVKGVEGLGISLSAFFAEAEALSEKGLHLKEDRGVHAPLSQNEIKKLADSTKKSRRLPPHQGNLPSPQGGAEHGSPVLSRADIDAIKSEILRDIEPRLPPLPKSKNRPRPPLGSAARPKSVRGKRRP